jgi:hypothetical protein
MVYLREKTDKWADQVRTGHHKKQDAWLCLQTTIMRTIEYALPTTTLSRKQLDYIMAPVTDAGLSK